MEMVQELKTGEGRETSKSRIISGHLCHAENNEIVCEAGKVEEFRDKEGFEVVERGDKIGEFDQLFSESLDGSKTEEQIFLRGR